MRLDAVLSALFLVLVPVSATAQSVGTVDAAVDSLFAARRAPGSPGCAVAAEQAGRVVLRRAYGLADVERGVAISPETIFDAGSVAKQFTAAAVLLLARDGKLSLRDDVRKYVPEVPDYGATITIDHLLTHTNGLRDWPNVAYLSGLAVNTPDELLALVARQRGVNFAPGEQFVYSNTASALAAIIVRRVSGLSLPAFTRERIFVPLGMTSTGWRGAGPGGQARAYRKTASGLEPYMPTSQVIGSGGLLTTVGDLLRWNSALASGQLGDLATGELQFEARLTDGRHTGYARGLYVGRYRNLDEIYHDGGDHGYRAWSGRYPTAGLSVALLCNTLVGDVTALGRRVVDRLLPPEQRTAEPAQRGALSADGTRVGAAEAARLAGVFISDELGLPLFLTADGDRLNVEGSYATRVGPDRYRVTWADITFEGPDVIRLVKSAVDHQTLRRVPGPASSGAELEWLVGRYHSAELDATYIASAADNTLRLELEGRLSYAFTFKPIARDVFQAGSVIMRVRRDVAGRPSAIAFSMPRVRELRFDRTPSAP